MDDDGVNDFDLTQTNDIDAQMNDEEDILDEENLVVNESESLSTNDGASSENEVLKASDDDVLGTDRHATQTTISHLNSLFASARAGDNIFLNGLTFTGSFSSISVTKSLNIYGGSYIGDPRTATIDLSQCYHPKSDRIKFSDIINIYGVNFVNHYYSSTTSDDSGRGHLISSTNALSLYGCSFINNSVFQKSSIIEYSKGGTSLSTINNCYFYNNAASVIINTKGSGMQFTANNNRFINNTGTLNLVSNTNSLGLCIKVQAQGATFDNNTFINNTNAVHGAAYCVDARDVKITNNYIAYNRASYGAGIESNLGTVYVYNTTFIGNIASGNNAWQKDRAGTGGAISFIGQDNTIEECTFINNYAENYGGAVDVRPSGSEVADDTYVLNSRFENNIAQNQFGGAVYMQGENAVIDDCNFTNNSAPTGGAVQIIGLNAQIYSSKFVDNNAIIGGAYYVEGNYAQVYDSYFENNTAVKEGGAINLLSNDATVLRSIFVNNTANRGGAIFANAADLIAEWPEFTGNQTILGGAVYLNGNNMILEFANFTGNAAIQGGAFYVNGENNKFIESAFTNNNATYDLRVSNSDGLKTKGGAIYINQANAIIENTTFYNNSANTMRQYNGNGNDPSASDDGFGGAIYVGADGANITSSQFNDNKACNGSALYNAASGTLLNNDTFIKNQAWSYILNVAAVPNGVHYGGVVIVVLNHIGGDNILNAIYNAAGVNDIVFNEVTYIVNNSESETRQTGKFVSPVLGATLSTDLYQDSLERYQEITIELISKATGKVVLTKNVKTDLYANYSLNVFALLAGNYAVRAYHNDDRNYKYILSTAELEIIPFVDLNIAKEVSSYYTIQGNNVTFTVTVSNANNASNATNLIIKDVLPIGLENIRVTATKGDYDKAKNLWTISQLDNGTSAILTMTFDATNIGKFNNAVNVACNEDEWNYANNDAEVWFEVIPFSLKINNTAEVDTIWVNNEITFTINVTNNNPVDATDVTITDAVPAGFEFVKSSEAYDDETGVLTIPIVKAGESYAFTITLKAVMNGTLTNTANVRCSENDTVITASADVNVIPVVELAVVNTADIDDATLGDIITFTITVTNNGPSNATNIKVTDSLDKGLTLVGGELEQVIPFLASGESTTIVVKAQTTAYGIYTNNVNVTCNQNDTVWTSNASVHVYRTDIKINNAAEVSVVSQNGVVKSIIVVNIDVGNATGYVHFTINGKEYRQNLENGSATFNLENIAPSNYSVTVYFVGSGDWANATENLAFEVYKQKGTIKASNAAYSIVYGGTYSVKTNMPNQKVTFAINGKTCAVNTDDNGVARLKLTGAMLGGAGAKSITVNGDNDFFTTSPVKAQITVKKEKTKVVAKKTVKFKKSKKTKKVKVTLKDSKNKAVRKVKVTLKIKGKKANGKKTYTLKTNNKGVVTFKITSKKTKFTKKGKCSATITFKGNNKYNKVTKKVKLVIR